MCPLQENTQRHRRDSELRRANDCVKSLLIDGEDDSEGTNESVRVCVGGAERASWDGNHKKKNRPKTFFQVFKC